MKLTADYHTHTIYSDGKNTALENAQTAREIGLKEIAITEHGFSHYFRGLKRKEEAQWFKEVREADKLENIKVLAGMECNIRGVSGLTDFTQKDYENFEVFLAGVHVAIRCERVFCRKIGYDNWLAQIFHVKPPKYLVRDTTKAYINTIKKNPVDVITHLNYFCVSDAVEVAKCCRDYGTYLEISSKKQHLTDDELAEVVNTGVRFVVNSDAHSVDRIGDTKLAEEQILRVGVPIDRIDNIDGKIPVFRFAEYKKHM